MNPTVANVTPLANHILKLTFSSNETRLFDVKPYLGKGIFRELKDEAYFKSVRIAFGAVEWPNEQDFSNDTLYLLGQPITA